MAELTSQEDLTFEEDINLSQPTSVRCHLLEIPTNCWSIAHHNMHHGARKTTGPSRRKRKQSRHHLPSPRRTWAQSAQPEQPPWGIIRFEKEPLEAWAGLDCRGCQVFGRPSSGPVAGGTAFQARRGTGTEEEGLEDEPRRATAPSFRGSWKLFRGDNRAMIVRNAASADKAMLSLDGRRIVPIWRGPSRHMLAAASRPASPPSTLILAPQSAPRCFLIPCGHQTTWSPGALAMSPGQGLHEDHKMSPMGSAGGPLPRQFRCPCPRESSSRRDLGVMWERGERSRHRGCQQAKMGQGHWNRYRGTLVGGVEGQDDTGACSRIGRSGRRGVARRCRYSCRGAGRSQAAASRAVEVVASSPAPTSHGEDHLTWPQLAMASTEHPVQHTTRQGAKATGSRGERQQGERERELTRSRSSGQQEQSLFC